jgi:hypothetical protein
MTGGQAGDAKAQFSTSILVIAVQFISTAADNAMLIVVIARVIELHEQAWIIPVLKLSLTFCYVLLAPFVGPFADFLAKGRVMLLVISSRRLRSVACCRAAIRLWRWLWQVWRPPFMRQPSMD